MYDSTILCHVDLYCLAPILWAFMLDFSIITWRTMLQQDSKMYMKISSITDTFGPYHSEYSLQNKVKKWILSCDVKRNCLNNLCVVGKQRSRSNNCINHSNEIAIKISSNWSNKVVHETFQMFLFTTQAILIIVWGTTTTVHTT